MSKHVQNPGDVGLIFAFRFLLFIYSFSTFARRPNILLWHSKSYFDIRTEADYCILTIEILFCYSHWGRISYCFHLKSCFTIRTEADCRILTFQIRFWHSHWSQKSYFDIKILFFTFALRPNIVVIWHSKSYFDIRTAAENPNLAFKFLLWQSHWGGKSYYDIQNPILTFALRPNIFFFFFFFFWHSKFYLSFAMRRKITFWHSKSNLIFALRPIIVFCHSKS